MIERPGLVIHAWQRRPPATQAEFSASDKAAISDLADGRALGEAERNAPAWLGWLGPRRIRIFEAEDRPLLLTLSRGVFGGWRVQDADDHLIGTVFRTVIFDARQQLLGYVKRPAGESETVVVTPDDRELAAMDRAGERLALRFSSALDGLPLARLLILGAALVLWSRR